MRLNISHAALGLIMVLVLHESILSMFYPPVSTPKGAFFAVSAYYVSTFDVD